ncbi:hypothetical protein [Avibacterium sp. 21-594]|uniref:hypothetical protein n=1 Tax=Avibacterium sp. 21-594 TaxID=2911535 RepID=UPI00224566E5|nr:hypothetical protein [Avibacterium sp. 21-594]MCW9716749.1 hypothetical protein [Avibacterium sp. 21-594]
MKKLCGVVAISCILSACATTPVFLQDAKPVPENRVLAFKEYNPEYAKVTITRDAGALGSGCYLGVMYRQTLLARFDPKENATFYIPEGEWKFAVTPDPMGRGLCSGAMGFNPAVEIQKIEKNKENLFRISSGPYRRPRLLPM